MTLGEDFYELQLRAGEGALAAGRFAEGVEDLRIAAFGFLDRPVLLCEALEALSVAEQAAGHADRAEGTLMRLATINRGFPACREARLDPNLRGQFESLARKRLLAPVADELLAPPPLRPTPSSTATVVTIAPVATARPTTELPRPTSTPMPTRAAAPVATVPPTPPSITPSAEPASVSPSEDLDRQPQLKVATRAVYPADAQRAGIGGIVLLRVLVSEKGEPARVEVARGVRQDLDQAAVAAVRQWLFEPGKKDGKAVAAWMTVAVPFDASRK
jgi:protein TonB